MYPGGRKVFPRGTLRYEMKSDDCGLRWSCSDQVGDGVFGRSMLLYRRVESTSCEPQSKDTIMIG